MFTGIITAVGEITSLTKQGDWRFEVKTPWACDKIALGASIACSGVCLTVIETTQDSFRVEVSGETLNRTTLSKWNVGQRINLEPALKNRG